ALMRERIVAPRRTVMVGDSSVDVLTARNAGTLACGVQWGFQPETFLDAPPDLLIDDLRELSRLVCG
ncbi:MAG: HAD hydrolase-like protein, partial [Acidobacteriota bacterium]